MRALFFEYLVPDSSGEGYSLRNRKDLPYVLNANLEMAISRSVFFDRVEPVSREPRLFHTLLCSCRRRCLWSATLGASI